INAQRNGTGTVGLSRFSTIWFMHVGNATDFKVDPLARISNGSEKVRASVDVVNASFSLDGVQNVGMAKVYILDRSRQIVFVAAAGNEGLSFKQSYPDAGCTILPACLSRISNAKPNGLISVVALDAQAHDVLTNEFTGKKFSN